MESVDRNSAVTLFSSADTRSLSAWRAWIEILIFRREKNRATVALRMESVDRNMLICPSPLYALPVALRMESVDRNKRSYLYRRDAHLVALRMESVDRNNSC